MAGLDPELRKELIDGWLPRLREIEKERRLVVRLMMAALLIPLVLALFLAFYQIIIQDVDAFETTLCGILVGWSALVFVYLGKLQECNDVLKVVEALVFIGDREELIRAISMLSCLGQFKELLQSARKLG